MKIKTRIYVICTLVLSLIVSGCGSHQRLEPTQTFSTPVHTLVANEVPTLMETPRPPVVAVTSTLHPSLINCIPTPVSVFSEEVPNTPETQEIIKTVQKSEEIYMRALITSDPSEFPTVFINDPRFLLSPKNLDTVRRLSNQPSLQSAGYLDYKIAYFTWQIKEGRFVAASYLHTPKPSQTVSPDFVWCDHSFSTPELRVLSMNIDDDIATIVINEGEATYELTLVFINDQWFIAG
ncbi:MAG TPA: hypothetical protein VLF17_06455 [Candidatus Nitrosotenuis sp.]|nr:hypothetical protein [Candidatus Nitrosotenuis sp.]